MEIDTLVRNVMSVHLIAVMAEVAAEGASVVAMGAPVIAVAVAAEAMVAEGVDETMDAVNSRSVSMALMPPTPIAVSVRRNGTV